jgi:hypothetical protein
MSDDVGGDPLRIVAGGAFSETGTAARAQAMGDDRHHRDDEIASAGRQIMSSPSKGSRR